MRKLRTKFVLWPKKVHNQDGFGIIESLIVLAIISAVAAGLSQYFLSSKDIVIDQKARLAFEEDMLRLMMITEENSVCEHLNFVNSSYNIKGANTILGSINKIDFDKVTMLKIGKEKRYEIKSIELKQQSIVYAKNPTRARGALIITPIFYDKNGKPKTGAGLPKKGQIDVIIASDSGGQITSCYGTFSRKISCLDGNGKYNPEASPNCQY